MMRFFVVVVALVVSVKAYSRGPPATTCRSMTPGHPAGISKNKGNVMISTSQNLDGSLSIECKMNDTSAFKGFFMQVGANTASSPWFGSFEENLRTDGFNCGYAHTDNDIKTSAKGTWEPQTASPPASVKIRCTLVKTSSTDSYHDETIFTYAN